MATLLEKTRKINKLLQKAEVVEYDSISRVLSNVIEANVYIVSKTGKIYGYAFLDDFECDTMIDKIVSQGEFPKHYVNWLLKMDSTSSNIPQKEICAFDDNSECLVEGKITTIVPIYGVGERIGTLVLVKFGAEGIGLCRTEHMFFEGDRIKAVREMIVAEDVEARKKATVQIALATLSYSEIEAAVNILSELNGTEGLLVASKIADRVGITRSVIVNALRKFESAGVIESKSLGMKGTYIRVLNEHLLDEIQKLKR